MSANSKKAMTLGYRLAGQEGVALITAKLITSPDGNLAKGETSLNPVKPWNNVCTAANPSESSISIKPKELPDFQFTIPSTPGATPFTVYAKIVDTVPGNSDMSGTSLMGSGVAESQNSITPQHIPYMYRVEVQAERSTNAKERANLSLLYAY